MTNEELIAKIRAQSPAIAQALCGFTEKQAAERMKSREYEQAAAKADVLLDIVAKAVME